MMPSMLAEVGKHATVMSSYLVQGKLAADPRSCL
jgi:hypothetical protein